MISEFNYQSKIINGVDVFLLKVDNNIAHIDKDIIPAEQVIDILNYKVGYDRNKRLLSRTFLYAFLKNRYEINNFELEYNQYKKPYLKFHQNIDFSISYSKEYILIAVSDKYQIGTDIEYIDKSINHNELKDIIMHRDEIIYSNNLEDDDEKIDFFFGVFNIKETIIKGLGMGLYIDIKEINIFFLDQLKEIKEYQYFLDINTFADINNYKTSLILFN